MPGWVYQKIRTRIVAKPSGEAGDLAVDVKGDQDDGSNELMTEKRNGLSTANGTARKRQSRAR